MPDFEDPTGPIPSISFLTKLEKSEVADDTSISAVLAPNAELIVTVVSVEENENVTLSCDNKSVVITSLPTKQHEKHTRSFIVQVSPPVQAIQYALLVAYDSEKNVISENQLILAPA